MPDRSREAGKGLIGFLIAAVLLVLAFISLKEIYTVKKHGGDLTDFVTATVKDAAMRNSSVEDVRAEIRTRIRELGIPDEAYEQLEVTRDSRKWHIRTEWNEPVKLPGYTYTWHHVVDESWTLY